MINNKHYKKITKHFKTYLPHLPPKSPPTRRRQTTSFTYLAHEPDPRSHSILEVTELSELEVAKQPEMKVIKDVARVN